MSTKQKNGEKVESQTETPVEATVEPQIVETPKVKPKMEKNEFEVQIETMLEKVFRIIREGIILHEYLTDKEYATLAVTLKNINPPLRGLRISQVLEKPLSTYALTQLLSENHSLEWFHLEANQIESNGIQAIAEILKENTKLEEFYCGFLANGLSTADIKSLFDMLLVNKTLKNVNLYANVINAEKAKIIADTLGQNPALAKLGLASNEIGNEGALALAEALTKNTQLLELNVADCRLGNQGMKAIFHALRKNTALRKLTLHRLDQDVIPVFAEMLAENETLQKLHLSLYTSELTTDQMKMLLESLRKNKRLIELNIQDDDGKLKAELTEISQILKTNLETPIPPKAEEEKGKAGADEANKAKQETAKQPGTDGKAAAPTDKKAEPAAKPA